MNKHDNLEVNFSLKGNASSQIGVYFLITAYLIKTILDGFLIDDNLVGMFSPEILEFIITGVTFSTFLLSGLALYFKGKRNAKKFEYQLFNKKNQKKFLAIYFKFYRNIYLFSSLKKLGLYRFYCAKFSNFIWLAHLFK